MKFCTILGKTKQRRTPFFVDWHAGHNHLDFGPVFNLHPLIASPQQENFLGWSPNSRAIADSLYEEDGIHHLFIVAN